MSRDADAWAGVYRSVQAPVNPDVELARRYGRGSFPWCCQQCGQDREAGFCGLCRTCLFKFWRSLI